MVNHEPEREIYNVDSPNSVINLVPPYVQNALRQIEPDYLLKDEIELKKILKPTAVMNRLRLRFWEEYDFACAASKQMRMTKVYAGVCHVDYWDKVVCKDARYFAWIACPPVNYEVAMKDILDEGIRQIRKIITANIVDENGKMDARAAEIFLKAYALVDVKVHGMPVLRTENKTLQVNMNHEVPVGSSGDLPVDENGSFTMEGIDRKLMELKKKQAALSQVGPPPGTDGEEAMKYIDVTPPPAPVEDFRLAGDESEE
jgi:hypothetical protein